MHTTSLRVMIKYSRSRKTSGDIRTTMPAGSGPTLRPRFSMKELRAA